MKIPAVLVEHFAECRGKFDSMLLALHRVCHLSRPIIAGNPKISFLKKRTE